LQSGDRFLRETGRPRSRRFRRLRAVVGSIVGPRVPLLRAQDYPSKHDDCQAGKTDEARPDFVATSHEAFVSKLTSGRNRCRHEDLLSEIKAF
jgi:hypothetical protein